MLRCFFKILLLLLFIQGAPSYVRLFRHPNFDSPSSVLANKSFFKADRVELLWNKKGKCQTLIDQICFGSINMTWYNNSMKKLPIDI